MVGRDTVGLPGSGVATARSTWTAPADAVSGIFRATVDPDGLIPEVDEDDNSITLTFETQLDTLPNPSLAEDAVSFSAAPYHEGEPMAVDVRLQNTGGAPASGTVTIYLNNEAGDVLATPQAFSNLAIAGETNLSFSINPITFRGNHLILAKIDTPDAESNSADNAAYKSIYAVGGPNPTFAATPMSLDPSWPGEGESTTVYVNLENPGILPANGLVVSLRADDEAGPLLGQTTLDLESGNETISFQITASASIQRLVCLIDPDNQIIEQVETDNQAILGLVVRNGEIAVDEPIFSPNGDGIKDQVTLFWSRPETDLNILLTNGQGDVVRSWEARPGTGSLVWDGTDSDGKVLIDGYFLFQLQDPTSGFPLRDQTVTVDNNNGTIRDSLAASDPGFYDLSDQELDLGAGWLGWAEDSTSLLAAADSSGPALYVAPDGSSVQLLGDDPYAHATGGFSLAGFPGQWLVHEDGGNLKHYADGVLLREASLSYDDKVQGWVRPELVLVGILPDLKTC